MANPKHNNPTEPRKNRRNKEFWAHAPYNFVPLPEDVITIVPEDIPGHDSYTHASGPTYTGYLDCTLETKTPTYTRSMTDLKFFQEWSDNIREMMKDDGERKKYAQFFSLDDGETPLIPGSSLRGMTRALVEIVGYGKVQWVTENHLFFRTMDNTAIGKHYREERMTNVEAGFLRKRGTNYYIKKCHLSRVHRSKLGNNKPRLYQGSGPNKTPIWQGTPHQYQPVWVKLSDNGKYVDVLKYPSEKNLVALREGRLVITGDMNGKKKEFVFLLPEQNAEEIEVSEKIIERFHDDDQITRWQREAFKKDDPRKDTRPRDGMLSKDLSGEGDPIFFLREDRDLTFFGRAQMFRLPYTKRPIDHVPPKLRDETKIDLAEAMFGYIPDGKEHKEGRAGRVYFTDATYVKDEGQKWYRGGDGIIKPKILTSPKPTTFQHYLVQDKKKGHDPDSKDKLAHYGTPTSDETVIRGHKLYWHKNSVNQKDFEESDPVDWQTDSQHTQIKPVNKGVTFRFKVHFENLRDYELGALLWVLDLPEDKHHHKIGMGKPLGLGSVKIKPALVLSDRQQRYRQLFEEDGWHTAEKQNTDLGGFKQAFDQFILAGIDEEATSLAEIKRIEILLKMLEYPGPDGKWRNKKLTDYMELEDFRERPVLPDPFHIDPPPDRRSSSRSTSRQSGQSRHQIQSRSAKTFSSKSPKPEPKSEPKFSHPATDADIKEGMYLEGRVIRVETTRVVVDIGVGVEATLSKQKIVPPVRNKTDLKRRFPKGKTVQVWVSGRNKKGRIQLTTQQP